MSNTTIFKDLIGKTLKSVVQDGKESITFKTKNKTWVMFHEQDCCEGVEIEDICGDLQDLVGSPLIQAEVCTSNENPAGVKYEEYQDSFTWTFYKFATSKGFVTIRWYGSSNGYYSEEVTFKEVKDERTKY